MYDLPYHKERDEKEIQAFIGRYPFAFLSGCDGENKPVVTQVPLFLEEKEGEQVLRGHLMKHTDHHKAFLHNPHALAVFSGKSTYVSGTWYSNPHTASTWNYMSAHVTGCMRFVGEEELEEILRMTSLHFEEQNTLSETTFDNLPEAFKQRVMHAIVGFEIQVEKIDTVFKLSQDRDAQSYQNIIEKLRERGADAGVIAAEMEKRQQALFGG